MDTGDTVLHQPTGEEWLVAFVENSKVCCCGWPLTYADKSDCLTTVTATSEFRKSLLRRMANMQEPDPRREYARRVLNLEVPK